MRENNIRLISGSASMYLAKEIAEYLNIPLTDVFLGRFKDGEIRVQIKENIRGEDVFIIQSTHPPAENLLELIFLIDAAMRASAKRITAVIPYFGYARQDRKDQPRVPISAKVVANLIQSGGAHRVLTIDLHADQIQGFFDIPVDNLFATAAFKEYLGKLDKSQWTAVAPDVGAIKRARAIAKKIGDLPLALIDKRRPEPNIAEAVHVIGDVKDKNLLILDDIIDTGNSIKGAVVSLIENGAKKIKVAASHALFSDNAIDRLNIQGLDEIIVTNTIHIDKAPNSSNLTVLSIAPLLAEAVKRIHEESSISELFI